MNPVLIDIAGWTADDFFATYPEGARDKRALFPPEDCALPFINKSRRHLFKLSDKRYPEQYWGEIVAYRIGAMVGVDVPPAYPAIDRHRGESAALIEWFYADGESNFVPGGRYMQMAIEDFDMKTGRQHNFQQIRIIFRALRMKIPEFDRDWLKSWAKGMVFDALIGNTDRHQNNWGLLLHNRPNHPVVTLSPWFDNGTSLGCDRWQRNVDGWTEDRLTRYLYNGQHHLRWNRSTEERCGFFEMPRLLVELDERLRAPMLACVQAVDLPVIESFLDQCSAIPTYVPLTLWRAKFMLRLIERRQRLLLDVLS